MSILAGTSLSSQVVLRTTLFIEQFLGWTDVQQAGGVPHFVDRFWQTSALPAFLTAGAADLKEDLHLPHW